ncbi:GTP cyclohydrolase I [Streptomyces sp. NPDC006798]|uniref:GTP cyclohydrolase I n=1 Tax=Streptomyces sp. NPDC006798 TaxID=3155462 RepID=UPI0033DFA35B
MGLWGPWGVSGPPPASRTAHESATVGGDELVIVSGITVNSLCEHYLQPMTLTVSAGYRPAGRVIGLSKIARFAVAHGHRLRLPNGS